MTRASSGPSTLYVLGGRQRQMALTQQERQAFTQAIVAEVDLEALRADERFSYTSPPEVKAQGDLAANVFKAGTRKGDHLYLCTETEVLVYRLPGFELVRYLSLPLFNDLHHVRPLDRDSLLVVVTGLDMMVEIDTQDRVVREWNVLGGDPWEHFDRSIDYRRESTKPHRSHPNFVFEACQEIWVTRFEQRDAVCVTAEGQIDIGVQRPHDGVVHAGRIYFTTVDGHVVIADASTARVERVVDLNPIVGGEYALGWCRGILPIDTDRVVVGFSRFRPTRFGQNLRWLRGRLGLHENLGSLPTRIACFDLSRRTVEWEVILEDAGVNVLFSIHPGAD